MTDIERIARLLESPLVEVRVAAAIVLGELKTKNAKAVAGLLELATCGDKAQQLPALEALEKIRAKRALSRLLPLLADGPTDVRRAAGRAIAALGPDVVQKLKARLKDAGAEERRIVSEVLAGVGGRDAFATLLEGLMEQDADSGRRAALAVRQQIREASDRERKSYLTQAQKFLQSKGAAGSPAAVGATLKILGFLERPEGVKLLLKYARDKKRPESVRHEAVVGLRFALGAVTKAADRTQVVNPLLDMVEQEKPALSRAARDTLLFTELPAATLPRLKKIAHHKSNDRARFAVGALAEMGKPAAWDAIAEVLAQAERANAEIAAEALAESPDAAAALAKALCSADDAHRAWIIARVLEPHAEAVDAKTVTRLLKLAVERLQTGKEAWEAPLKIARIASPPKTAKALKELASAVKRAKDKTRAIRVFRLLVNGNYATDEDKYALASLELRESPRDVRPSTRARDPALTHLGELIDSDFDVGAAMRKDRALSLEEKYYAGFHFIEDGEPLGEALLEEVAQKGGRKKIGKAARNKLKLAQR